MTEKVIQPDHTVSASRADNEHTVHTICPAADLRQTPQRETVCVVCGHVNRGETLICEMCSNYLFI